MAAKGWGKSKVTRESLLPYVASGVIPEFKQERWRVPPANEVEPLPRPGEFVIFLSFLDRGFALPTSDFLRQLLAFYSIKVSDLGPHSVQQISLFVALCECYLGCPPFPTVGINLPRAGDSGQQEQRGAHPRWNHLPVHSPGEVCIPQFSPEPSVPRRLNVRSLREQEVVKEMRRGDPGAKDSGDGQCV
ncbi:hypothetical protein QYE76_003400 [Lolium multiflorum]|uniref:Transposase (putative) gypsy type domain-containing protein n=1 Tax=Lolium multiflorum TaxID=4521 RepID=A0AAD8VYS9_LOLMU|nr:hypothetical protein QYE76_003400 [Lolium multiflorum]